jgi:hypothetical protein
MPSRGRRSNAARRQLDAAAERACQRREEEERSREAEERKLDEDNDAVEDYEDLVEDDDDLVEDDDGVEGDDEHGDEGAAAGDGNNTATGNVPIPENLRTRALGQAQATAQLEKSAGNLIKAYRKSRLLPVDLAFEEIMGENLEEYMSSIFWWLSETPIPFGGFDEDLNPKRNTNKCLKPSTLLAYVGQELKRIRRLFPQHPDFSDPTKDRQGGYC